MRQLRDRDWLLALLLWFSRKVPLLLFPRHLPAEALIAVYDKKASSTYSMLGLRDNLIVRTPMLARRLEIRQNLGHALCKVNRWNEAIAEFEELLKTDPTWNMARPCLYGALRAVGRNIEAQKVYKEEQKYRAMGYEP